MWESQWKLGEASIPIRNQILSPEHAKVLKSLTGFFRSQTMPANIDNYVIDLSNIRSLQYPSFICKIVAYGKDRNDVYIWDGTIVPDAEEQARCLTVHELIKLSGLELSGDYPQLGTIVILSTNDMPLFQEISPGSWVKMTNVRAMGKNIGTIEPRFTVHSSVIALDPNSAEVKLREKRWKSLNLNIFKVPLCPRPGLASFPHPQFLVTTIKSILLTRSRIDKFRIAARCTSYVPYDAIDLTRRFCAPCGLISDSMHCCKCGQISQWKYMCALTFQDTTGSLQATCCLDHADKFFQGIPACNLRENNSIFLKLQFALNQLLSQELYIDACVLMYEDLLARRRFQLVDTSLKIPGFVPSKRKADPNFGENVEMESES